LEIAIEPWKKLVIHEIIEQRFEDLMRQIVSGTKYSGGGIPTISWANGIIFSFVGFPDTETIVEEKIKGIIRYLSITFAVKEKFESQIIREGTTINFSDVSHNEIFGKLADTLKAQSKFKST